MKNKFIHQNLSYHHFFSFLRQVLMVLNEDHRYIQFVIFDFLIQIIIRKKAHLDIPSVLIGS